MHGRLITIQLILKHSARHIPCFSKRHLISSWLKEAFWLKFQRMDKLSSHRVRRCFGSIKNRKTKKRKRREIECKRKITQRHMWTAESVLLFTYELRECV